MQKLNMPVCWSKVAIICVQFRFALYGTANMLFRFIFIYSTYLLVLVPFWSCDLSRLTLFADRFVCKNIRYTSIWQTPMMFLYGN